MASQWKKRVIKFAAIATWNVSKFKIICTFFKPKIDAFERINELDTDYSYCKILTLFAPWNTTWHCFYPINPKAHVKMAPIVNKVYWSHGVSWLYFHRIPVRLLSEGVGGGGVERKRGRKTRRRRLEEANCHSPNQPADHCQQAPAFLPLLRLFDN